jgi:hypothetical protein
MLEKITQWWIQAPIQTPCFPNLHKVGGGKYQLNKQQQEEINNHVKGTKKHT